MMRSIAFCLLITALLPTASLAQAQQPLKKTQRIAVLSPGTAPRPVVEALRHGLREFGYIEGQNVVFDYPYADWKSERLPQLPAELVPLKPNIIFTQSVTGAKAAKQATSTIPIVIGAAGDLVRDGIVASLARPGGNVTGVTLLSTELEGKRLELLKETSRSYLRLPCWLIRQTPRGKNYPQVLEPAGRALKLRLQRTEIGEFAELEDAFAVMPRNGIDGVLVVSDPMFQALSESHRGARRQASPAEHFRVPGFAGSGGLVQIGLSIPEMGRPAAAYVDKILKGAKPAVLPVERPTKFEFLINLKTAKQLV